MGFFDSIGSAFNSFSGSSFGQGLGNILGQAAGQALGGAVNLGLGKLFGTNVSGSPWPTPGAVNLGTPQNNPLLNLPSVGGISGPLSIPGQPQFGTNPVFLNPQLFPTAFGTIGQQKPSLFAGTTGIAGNPGGSFGGQSFVSPLNPAPASLPFQPAGIPPGFIPIAGGGVSQASFIGPGGNMPAFPVSSNQSFFSQALDLPFIDIVGQGGGQQLSSMFKPGMAGARAQTFMVPNPQTGRPTWFKPAGQPILFSGDLAACKRVDRVARRARMGRRKR